MFNDALVDRTGFGCYDSFARYVRRLNMS